MIIILKSTADKESIQSLLSWLTDKGYSISHTGNVIYIEGDTFSLDENILRSFDIVNKVQRISKSYYYADRANHPEDTIIRIKGIDIGSTFTMIAGPCTIESYEMLLEIGSKVKASGANILRGGAFKPRSSTYSFQGLGEDAVNYLVEAGKELNIPTITEIMDSSQLSLFENIDILQVGSKNMQNYELLKALGETDKPILLKRGLSSTINEFLMSAEYILSRGNSNVILCERGIRTFETATRNTLDLSSVPLLKELTHLPVIVDPSHATGISKLVEPMSLAACACGADGLMIEVHNNPSHALCDGPQAITPGEFSHISNCIHKILPYSYNTK